MVRNLPANTGDIRDRGFIPGSGRSPGGGRAWEPTPVFLPGKSHAWRSVVCYGPWGHKESDTAERLHFTSLQRSTIRSLTRWYGSLFFSFFFFFFLSFIFKIIPVTKYLVLFINFHCLSLTFQVLHPPVSPMHMIPGDTVSLVCPPQHPQ